MRTRIHTPSCAASVCVRALICADFSIPPIPKCPSRPGVLACVCLATYIGIPLSRNFCEARQDHRRPSGIWRDEELIPLKFFYNLEKHINKNYRNICIKRNCFWNNIEIIASLELSIYLKMVKYRFQGCCVDKRDLKSNL